MSHVFNHFHSSGPMAETAREFPIKLVINMEYMDKDLALANKITDAIQKLLDAEAVNYSLRHKRKRIQYYHVDDNDHDSDNPDCECDQCVDQYNYDEE